MIPGNASKAFNPSFFSMFFGIQSFTPPLLGGGGLNPATIEATMVLIAKLIAVNILNIVTPCSLDKVYFFAQPRRLFPTCY